MILNDFHKRRQSTIDMSIQPWLTAEDVAQHIGVAKDTVYRCRERKGLPAHRVGRLWNCGSFSCPKWMSGGKQEEPDFRERYELPDGLYHQNVPAFDEIVVRELLVNALVQALSLSRTQRIETGL